MHACVRMNRFYVVTSHGLSTLPLGHRRRQPKTKIDVETHTPTRRESLSQPQNIMYDKRVVRGSNYSHIHMQAVSSTKSVYTVFLCI